MGWVMNVLGKAATTLGLTGLKDWIIRKVFGLLKKQGIRALWRLYDKEALPVLLEQAHRLGKEVSEEANKLVSKGYLGDADVAKLEEDALTVLVEIGVGMLADNPHRKAPAVLKAILEDME